MKVCITLRITLRRSMYHFAYHVASHLIAFYFILLVYYCVYISCVFRAAMLPSFLLPLVAIMALLTSVYSRPRFTRSLSDQTWSPEHRGLDTELQAVAYNYRASTNTDSKLSPVKRSSLMRRVNRNAFRGPLEVRWWWQKVATTTKPDVPRWPVLRVPRFGCRLTLLLAHSPISRY